MGCGSGAWPPFLKFRPCQGIAGRFLVRPGYKASFLEAIPNLELLYLLLVGLNVSTSYHKTRNLPCHQPRLFTEQLSVSKWRMSFSGASGPGSKGRATPAQSDFHAGHMRLR